MVCCRWAVLARVRRLVEMATGQVLGRPREWTPGDKSVIDVVAWLVTRVSDLGARTGRFRCTIYLRRGRLLGVVVLATKFR